MTTAPKVQNFLRSPLRNFIFMWTPVLFSMLAEPLTGLVDTAFVARLGPEALAALGIGTVVLTSGMWLFNFLSVGSQTEVSQAQGKNEPGQGKSFSSLALLTAMVLGTVITVAAISFAPLLATLMGATDQVHQHAVTYIRIRAFGGPAVLLTMTSFGIMYGLANMRSPLLIAVTVNGLNILLDGLLIFGLGPFPEMGVAGAALASVLSQWAGVMWCMYTISRSIGFTASMDMGDVLKLIKIGRDMFLRTGSLLLFLLLATRSATQLSADTGAAHQAVRQVWVFTNLFLDASAITAQSLIGYYWGTGSILDARNIAKLVSLFTVFLGLFLMLFMLATSEYAGAILVPTSSLFLFYPAWIIAAVLQPVAALAFVTDGIHWGTGDFTFLRNVVVFATLCGIIGILAMEYSGVSSLTLIWWITGAWVLIRAIFGIVRIWPGMSASPLKIPAQL